jgi:small subunit ribosomal protein S4e
MHQTRQETTKKLPIKRKGTKYVVRALSNVKNSVPVLIAVRDMLKLARTQKEVQSLINQRILKINGRPVRNYHESIQLFNILEAHDFYQLTLLPTGRFSFFRVLKSSERLCKVTGKTILSLGRIQLNLHDGSNVISKDKISVGDSVYLDFEGKIKKHIPLAKGADVFVFGGKYIGQNGKIMEIKDRKALIKFKTGEAELPTSQLMAQ